MRLVRSGTLRVTERLLAAWVGVTLSVVAYAAPANRTPPPENVQGMWLTQDGNGVIQIAQCADALCGRIVGIRRAPGEPLPTDVRGQSQCGLTILSDERPTADGEWNGEITDPRSGKTYGAQLWLDTAGHLRVRGYLGLPLFGQTQTWRRFSGTITAGCEIA